MRTDRRSRRRKYLFAPDLISDAAIFKHDAKTSLGSRDTQFDSVGLQLGMQLIERGGAGGIEHRHRFGVQHQQDRLFLSCADCLTYAICKILSVEEDKS